MADRAAGLPADALPVATPEAVTRTDAIDAIVRVLEVNRPVHWRLIAADVYDAVRPVIAAEAARQERQRIDAGLEAITVRFARPALSNGTLGGWEEHAVVPIGRLCELVHAGCIRCQNLDGTITQSCYCREDVIEPCQPPSRGDAAGRWEAWTKPMPCGDSPDEHFQAGVLFGIAAERQRWERLSRHDGQDEQAEIYVGQALAYESLEDAP